MVHRVTLLTVLLGLCSLVNAAINFKSFDLTRFWRRDPSASYFYLQWREHPQLAQQLRHGCDVPSGQDHFQLFQHACAEEVRLLTAVILLGDRLGPLFAKVYTHGQEGLRDASALVEIETDLKLLAAAYDTRAMSVSTLWEQLFKAAKHLRSPSLREQQAIDRSLTSLKNTETNLRLRAGKIHTAEGELASLRRKYLQAYHTLDDQGMKRFTPEFDKSLDDVVRRLFSDR